MCSDKSGSHCASNSIIIIKFTVFEVDDQNFSTSPLYDNVWLAKFLTTEQTLVSTLIQYYFCFLFDALVLYLFYLNLMQVLSFYRKIICVEVNFHGKKFI